MIEESQGFFSKKDFISVSFVLSDISWTECANIYFLIYLLIFLLII